MATLLNSDSRRLYSWWWDSHIPKNSKWLQENLTDMDAKVKAMIKLIEEDADSFARRAEMYYKKRPELMKLVEEFYRAYRALAERYDHATGELRQAHRTMAEAFPNQVPFVLTDDSPSGTSGHEREPRTPEMSRPVRALFDLDDLHKDALGLSADLHAISKHGPDSAESLAIMGKRGLKQLHTVFGVESESAEGNTRKSPESVNKDRDNILNDQVLQLSDENQNLKNHVLSESERAGRAESEIEVLRKALAEMHTEKESILLQYQQSMQKVSNLEGELQRAETYSRGIDDQASKASAEVQTLRETLVKLQEEKESGSVRQKELSERILNLESMICQAQKDAQGVNERAIRSEVEAQYLERELARVETEKSEGLVQYKQCLENILNLEKTLLRAQEEARLCDERAHGAESEVRELKKTLSQLNEEKEAAGRQYENCMEKICKLEKELSCAQEEIRSLNRVLLLETSKLQNAEEKCSLLDTSNQSLRLEADNLAKKIALKDQELFEKLQALEKLEACVQNEHLHFVQVEATLQALQDLHSQSQDEQRALALKLETVLQMLKDLEILKDGLENEIRQVKDENRILNEKNSSSSITMDDLQSEILRLTEIKERLEEDVTAQTIQINSLQEEISRLKEHMDVLSERYQALMEQVEAVGLKPDCILSSVKDLQDENTKLKLICEEHRNDRTDLIKKLDNMDKILKEKTVLERSVSNLSMELDRTREKAQALQDSYQLLDGEKSVLVAEKAALFCQLQIITDNMKQLLEKNAVLENSLSGANVDLEGLRAKSKGLEEICKLLNDDKSNLLSERKALVVQLDNVERRLENLENRFCLLEQKYVGLEKEKEYTLYKVEELKVSLDEEKQERETSSLSSGVRLACLEKNLQIVQEESRCRKKEFEEELDRAVNAQLEIFILQKFVQDMEQKNYSLLIECQKHAEASKLAQKVISELEDENLEQQMEAEHLLDEIEKLRRGVYGVFTALDDGEDNEPIKKLGNEQLLLHHITEKVETMKCSLSDFEDDKQQLVVENSVLLTLVMELGVDSFGVESAKEVLQQDLNAMNEQFQIAQNEKHVLLEMNSKLKSEVHTADQEANELKTELEKLSVQHADLHGAYLKLQREYSQVTEENKSMLTKLSQLKNEKYALEEENDYILLETLAHDNVSVVLRNFMAESVLELKSQSEELHCFHGLNTELEKEIGVLRGKLEMRDADNLLLKDLLTKFEKDLHETRDLNNQLNREISIGQDLLHQHKIDASEAEKELRAAEELNSELCGAVEELKRQSEVSNIAKENLEKLILGMSEENACQSKEIESLNEANKNLASELGILREEIEECRSREDTLSSELHEISNEFEVWEAEAATFHFDLHISSTREALFENKVQELTQVCQSLESQNASKNSEIEQMKEVVGCMETKIGGLEAHLSAYAPVIELLKDNIASLEHTVFSDPVFSSSGNPEPEDMELDNHVHGESFQDIAENCVFMIPNGVPELKKLQDRIKAVEMVVTKEMQMARKERPNSNRVAEASRIEVKESESNCRSHLKNDNQIEETESGNQFSDKLRLQKTKPEYSEMKNGILMKDIPLDHISNSSFCARSSRRKSRGADDQMLELWEAAENDVGLDITFRSSHKQEYLLKEDDSTRRQIDQLVKPGSENPSSELEMERELGVDRLGVPTTKLKQEGTKRKVFERLDSDAQKLKTLQTTVDGLRGKMETNEKLKKKKKFNVDVETVKEQLQEVEETIVELVEVNGQMKRNIEETFLHLDGNASDESEVAWSGQRKKVSEQARKGSEKIGRLQLEVQKIQYVLLKLEDEKKSKAKNRFCRNKTSIIMRDFIYHGGPGSPRMKKGCLRGCFRSSTSREGTNSNVSS